MVKRQDFEIDVKVVPIKFNNDVYIDMKRILLKKDKKTIKKLYCMPEESETKAIEYYLKEEMNK